MTQERKEAIELDKMCVSEIVAKYESSHNAITVLKRKLRIACESDDWMKKATEFYENGGCPICFSTDEAGCAKGCYFGQLQIEAEKHEAAFREIIKESGEVDITNWPCQQQICQAIAQQALTKLKEAPEQPPTGGLTKWLRAVISRGRYEKGDKELQIKVRKLCGIIDRAEAARKDLLEALKQIRDLETECCHRCEGEGNLYADGKAHYMSENAPTIPCGSCGGSGRILPEDAQDIAEAALTKEKEGKE